MAVLEKLMREAVMSSGHNRWVGFIAYHLDSVTSVSVLIVTLWPTNPAPRPYPGPAHPTSLKVRHGQLISWWRYLIVMGISQLVCVGVTDV